MKSTCKLNYLCQLTLISKVFRVKCHQVDIFFSLLSSSHCLGFSVSGTFQKDQKNEEWDPKSSLRLQSISDAGKRVICVLLITKRCGLKVKMGLNQ